jgi:hypothetical protein
MPVRARLSEAALCLAALCGCASPYRPAVIVEETAQGRSELAQVVANALHTDRVVLADDALTTAPSLVIERTAVKDEQGRLLDGRDLSKPAAFELYAFRGRCLLERRPSGERWSLRTVRCQPTKLSNGLKKDERP